MINEVRNTVLSILNKNNNGYMTPEEFNLFARQAQLEIFEQYFYQLAQWKAKEHARMAGEAYADIVREYQEVLDTFLVAMTLTPVAGTNVFTLPENWYTLLKVNYQNPTGVFTEVERVAQYRINHLLNSNITAPTTTYPAYVLGPATAPAPPVPPVAVANTITVFPNSIDTLNDIVIDYVRYPVDPVWTYNAIGVDGDPVYDPTSASYADFELPLSDSIDLVIRICQYAGISIRESEVVQFELQEEATEQQNES